MFIIFFLFLFFSIVKNSALSIKMVIFFEYKFYGVVKYVLYVLQYMNSKCFECEFGTIGLV